MHFIQLFLLCLLCCFCSAKKDTVLSFNDQNFETKIADYDNALVLFYAPWCSHCKKLKPEFVKAADELIRNDPPVYLGRIDCTESGKNTCEKHKLSGYPTLKIFRKGKFAENYEGTRDADSIVKYMKAQVSSSCIEIATDRDLEVFLKDDKVAVVGFFDKHSKLKTALFEVSESLRHKAKFGHCSDKSVLKKQGISDGIILFRPSYLSNRFENDSVVYTGPDAVALVKKFIFSHYHGLAGHRKSDNKDDFKNPLVVVYYNIDYARNPKITNYYRNRVLKVAAQYKNEINFAISNRDNFQHELIEFNVTYEREDQPTVLARDADNHRFVMNETFSAENLHLFVGKLLEKKVKPYVKSEPVPEKNDGPVKVAVADNFDKVVVDNGKDTLVAFYAPWCGHCKRLAPLYEELGKKLKNEDVDVVKMDATANDIPAKFQVEGYPTVYWVPKEAKDEPVVYDGRREIDDLLKFIAEKSTHELEGYDRQGNPKEKTEKKILEKTEL